MKRALSGVARLGDKISVCIAAGCFILRGVRTVFTWLMLLGVFAGLSARAMYVPHFHDHSHSHAHAAEGCHEAGALAACDEQPQDPENTEGSHEDHHHHHACVLPGAIALADDAEWRLLARHGEWVEFHRLSLSPPEGPWLETDKPPLI
jgi:hypothetical protein